MRLFIAMVVTALLPCFASCAPYTSRPSGVIAVDGREFGQHLDRSPSCSWPARNQLDGSIELEFQVAYGHRSAQFAEVRFSPEAGKTGIDLHLPWSHVVFKPSDCTTLEVHVEHAEATDGIAEGNFGRLRATCKLPDSSDTFDADVTFKGC